jgi:hypothetical protein
MSTAKTVIEIVERFGSATSGEVDKAIALHDYLRENVKFGFNKYLDENQPDYTLSFGYGHCNAKSRLMVVLFRGIGFEAYQHFVVLPKEILRGVFLRSVSWVLPKEISHSYVDVKIDGKWCAIDSFIIDTPYLKAAQVRLAKEGRSLGYGVRSDSVNIWDGKSDAFSQFDRKLMIEDHGRVDNLEAYLRSSKYRTKFMGIRLNSIFRLIGETGVALGNSHLDGIRNTISFTAQNP